MPASTSDDLSDFIDQLRAKGVRMFKGPFNDTTIELELGPPVLADPVASKPEDDRCRCGHGPAEHGQGFCLRGCDFELCGDANAVRVP